jgi:hypothetical protein
MAHLATSSCVGYQQITSLSSAASLTVPTEGAAFAVVQPESQAVRYRQDGTNPTAGVGMQLAVGASVMFTGDLSRIKFIETAASAKLNVEYWK